MKKVLFVAASILASCAQASFASAGGYGGHHGDDCGCAMSELDIENAQDVAVLQAVGNKIVAHSIHKATQDGTNIGAIASFDLKGASQDNISLDSNQHVHAGQFGLNKIATNNLGKATQSITNVGASLSVDF